jgi:heme-degrading monooxygenase HmoA
MVVGIVGALAGGLLLVLAGPTTLGQGVGVILLIASPILAVSTGIVIVASGRKRGRHSRANGQGNGLAGAPPLPAAGHVRIGYYKFKPGTVDGVARRLQAEAAMLYSGEPGFIGHRLIRSGADELFSISQWATHAQAEAAVDRELRWFKSTVASTVVSTESHVGAIVGSDRG